MTQEFIFLEAPACFTGVPFFSGDINTGLGEDVNLGFCIFRFWENDRKSLYISCLKSDCRIDYFQNIKANF